MAVSVEDRGSGLDPRQLSLLFRKFSRLEEGERGDTGLGLVISKGIVEAHGGRMWAESKGPGRGATFIFTVPVAEEAGPGRKMMPARLQTGARQRVETGQVRILAVDDDPQVLRYLRDTITRAGYVPVMTGDPTEAVGLMETNAPHLAVLDLMLPGTDGIELMANLQTIADIPVIFLSAYGQEDVVARAFEEGADDYVVKPFSPTELVARIRAALRRRADSEHREPSEPYVRGEMVIDYAERRVSVAGSPVPLTAIQYRLLVELSANAGRTLTYDHLLERVWTRRRDGDLRPMRSAVKNVRRKLGDDAVNPTYIFTEPRVGYRMPAPERAGPETDQDPLR